MEMKVGGEGAIAASPEEIWNVIRVRSKAWGGLGKIDGTWQMQFQKKGDQQSQVIYAVNHELSLSPGIWGSNPPEAGACVFR